MCLYLNIYVSIYTLTCIYIARAYRRALYLHLHALDTHNQRQRVAIVRVCVCVVTGTFSLFLSLSLSLSLSLTIVCVCVCGDRHTRTRHPQTAQAPSTLTVCTASARVPPPAQRCCSFANPRLMLRLKLRLRRRKASRRSLLTRVPSRLTRRPLRSTQRPRSKRSSYAKRIYNMYAWYIHICFSIDSSDINDTYQRISRWDRCDQRSAQEVSELCVTVCVAATQRPRSTSRALPCCSPYAKHIYDMYIWHMYIRYMYMCFSLNPLDFNDRFNETPVLFLRTLFSTNFPPSVSSRRSLSLECKPVLETKQSGATMR